MLNRGVNGEEVADMLKRFDAAIVAAKPDLVLWQLGTNSVIRDQKIDGNGDKIRAGLAKIRSTGADVVLIDPQFAPKVIAKPEATHMVELIAATAKQEDVDLFPRFGVMKRWHDVDHMAFETFVCARRAAHERLELCLPRQGARPGDRRSRAAAGDVGDGVAAPDARRLTQALYRLQRRQQILDNVVRVFEPGRKPHQPVADAELGALRGRQAAGASSSSDA